jgi:hypothetical protein
VHRLGILLLLAAGASAQGTGVVRGSVVDARGGEALSSVDIQLVRGPHRAVTGAEGKFEINDVSPGEYILNVSTIGYRLLKKPFRIEAGEIKEFDIVLSPETFRITDSVEVSAGPFDMVRQDSPSALLLEGNDAKNLAGVLADDPLRAVQSLPGVTANDDFDARFNIRGADYSRIGVYVDGILLHMPFHTVEGVQATGSATAFNGDMLESLELHEGAWPVLFQDRTAGALDVRTREGSRTSTSVRVTASASNAGVMAEGPVGKRGSWLAGARKSYLQYILQRTSTDPSIAFGLEDVQGRLSYNLTPSHNLSLNLLESFSGLDRSSAQSKLGINSLMTAGYHFTFANLGWRYTPAAALMLNNHLAWMREKFYDNNPGNQPLGSGHYGEWVWDSTATWAWRRNASVDAGWSVRELRDSGYSNRLLSTPPYVRLLDRYHGTAARLGGYVQQLFTFASGRARLGMGVRWDRHSIDGVAAMSPQASASFALTRSTRLNLGWGQYVQFPEVADFASLTGSIRLLPFRATHGIVSLEQRLGERSRIRVEAYEREDRDLLNRPFYEPRILDGKVFTPPANIVLQNSVRGYARGVQVLVERRSANRLTGWVSYEYGTARERDGIERTAYPSDWDQRHTVNVFGGYRLRPSVNFSLKGMIGSGYPIPGFLRIQGGLYYLAAEKNRLRFATYQRLDWRVNKSWTKDRYKLTLYGELVNLTNRRNYRFDSLNGFNSRTGLASITLDRLFPILPSAGIVFER